MCIIKNEFNKTFPKKTIIIINNKTKFSDWATVGIYISRKKMFELYGRKAYSSDPDFIEYVKKYSKVFKQVCTMAKSIYIRDKIKNSGNKIKATWNCINKETCRIISRDDTFALKIDNKYIKCNDKVANAFEGYFSNVPIITTSNLNSCSYQAMSLLEGCVDVCNSPLKFRQIDPI